VHFTKGTDTYGFAEVDVSSHCCCPSIEPIWIIGGEFFERGGFDNVNPGGDFDFAYNSVRNVFKLKDVNVTYQIVSRIEHML
jgi:hypothetical protein